MHLRFICSFAAATTVLACSMPVTFSRTGPTLPSRGPQCSFRLLTAPPASPFIELGTAVLADASRHWRGSIEDLREGIAPSVCRAGGDAAIAFADGSGLHSYDRATIIKLGAEGSSTTGECHYDTQCKGQRICRTGTCVDP